MFRLNLKITCRNLWKNKSYTFINVFGLAVGMAGCILIFMFITYQLGFDKSYVNDDRIYRFVTNWQYPKYKDYSKGIPLPMAAAAKNELAGIELGAVIIKRGGIVNIIDASGKAVVKSREFFYYAEPEFFEIFQRQWIYGSPKESLSAPNMVAISDKTAISYFGNAANAMHKSLSIGTNLNLKVTGVFKDSPENSSFPLNLVVSYKTFNSKKYVNWDGVNSSMEFYILLKDGVSIANMIQPIATFNKKYYEDTNMPGHQSNTLQPLKDIHFDQRYGSFGDTSVSRKELLGLGIIGGILIITACINFINLTTAQAVNRSKEVGIRKVMGGNRKQILLQFLTESLVITSVSMLIACAITELVLPAISHLLHIPLSFSFFNGPLIIIFLTTLIFLVSLLAGLYPAIIVSGFSPALAIKNKVAANSGSLGLRRLLLVFQFTISIVLLIGTMVVIKQTKYFHEKPLGFNSEAVAMVSLPSDSLNQSKYIGFKNRILQIPGIRTISFCQAAPLSDYITTSDFSYNGNKVLDFELRSVRADENYFKLFDLQMITGKSFGKDENMNRAVVNETFLKKMDISKAESVIGKIISIYDHEMLITGVVKDYNDVSLKSEISPMIIFPQKSEYYSMAVKFDGGDMTPAMTMIKSLWNKTFSDYIYQSSLLKDDLSSYYESERIMEVLFKVAAGMIIFISLIGLFGLISFVAIQRTREIAIRKVLGASIGELVRLLNRSFLKMVIIANVLAWPLAYLFISKWLENFAYRVDINVWPFVYAFLISMSITILTVSIKSYKTALSNVINALKEE